MKRFAYQILTHDEVTVHNCKDRVNILNAYGDSGWELVAIQGIFWIMKRELPERHVGGPG